MSTPKNYTLRLFITGLCLLAKRDDKNWRVLMVDARDLNPDIDRVLPHHGAILFDGRQIVDEQTLCDFTVHNDERRHFYWFLDHEHVKLEVKDDEEANGLELNRLHEGQIPKIPGEETFKAVEYITPLKIPAGNEWEVPDLKDGLLNESLNNANAGECLIGALDLNRGTLTSTCFGTRLFPAFFDHFGAEQIFASIAMVSREVNWDKGVTFTSEKFDGTKTDHQVVLHPKTIEQETVDVWIMNLEKEPMLSLEIPDGQRDPEAGDINHEFRVFERLLKNTTLGKRNSLPKIKDFIDNQSAEEREQMNALADLQSGIVQDSKLRSAFFEMREGQSINAQPCSPTIKDN
ncbi:MAG: hypothetical protein QNK37_21475 [Acidobacteriota bacterium]|nr:hypothetical protein [Acidobacteriota bacterium]